MINADRFMAGVWMVDVIVMRDGAPIDEDTLVISDISDLEAAILAAEAKRKNSELRVVGTKLIRRMKKIR